MYNKHPRKGGIIIQEGYRIASLRLEQNISQEDLAKILGVSLYTYQKYEVNKSMVPIEKMNVLANLFDVSLDYLLGLSNQKEIKKISSEIDYKYLRFSLRYHRRMGKVSQNCLAKAFEVAPTTISNYEKLARNVPTKFLISFAKKFHISIDYICGKSLTKEIL